LNHGSKNFMHAHTKPLVILFT